MGGPSAAIGHIGRCAGPTDPTDDAAALRSAARAAGRHRGRRSDFFPIVVWFSHSVPPLPPSLPLRVPVALSLLPAAAFSFSFSLARSLVLSPAAFPCSGYLSHAVYLHFMSLHFRCSSLCVGQCSVFDAVLVTPPEPIWLAGGMGARPAEASQAGGRGVVETFRCHRRPTRRCRSRRSGRWARLRRVDRQVTPGARGAVCARR